MCVLSSGQVCAFEHFRKLQTELQLAPIDMATNKQQMRAKLGALRTELDGYLASEYGIDRDNIKRKEEYAEKFAKWRQSHQPFHWWVEFYGIMKRGGFDVIVGNPPYVEYSKIRKDYTVRGYETESCGNIYAAVIERSLALCRSGQGYLGLIVPLSICGGERFDQLRTTITGNTSSRWLSNFEIFPSRLFDGAFQRLSILVAKHSATQRSATYVTRIQRWYASERPHLIDLVSYTATQYTLKPLVFPKLASSLQEIILHKVLDKSNGSNVATVLRPHRTEYFVYYQEATNYWMKATCRVPFYQKNGIVMEPQHGRFLFFSSKEVAHIVMALMNSSLFYLYFATFSDGFHLSHALVQDFPVGKDVYVIEKLSKLSIGLEGDIRANTRMGTRNTKTGDNIEIEEYRMGYSKSLLDDIDGLLAKYYGFTDEELDFIINYDIKYRMGRDSGDESQE